MQPVSESLSRFTPLSLFLSILISVGYLVTLFLPNLRKYVVLIPGKASFVLWSCVTSSFVVLNPLEVLIDVVVLLFVGKILEPVYGVVEMTKYLLLVSAATGFSTFAVAYATFVIRRSVLALYIHIAGFHGLLGAMLVAFKQVAPDHTLIFCDALKIKAEWLASIYVVLGMPVGLFYHPLTFYPFLLFGTYFSWFYLRFLQVDPRTQLKGDPSPSFRFASFFPEVMRPSVNRMASFCSKVFQIRTKEPIRSAYPSSSNAFQHDPYDQARRRERGQKALEARLSVMDKNEGGPSLEGESVV